MKFIRNDGGRAEAGFRGAAGDCVTRSIAIAAERPYIEIYRAMAHGSSNERLSRGPSARSGIHTTRKWFKDYMRGIGFTWTPTMHIGSGCKVHLVADELPTGRLVVMVSKHCTAVINGVIHDTYNPSDRGTTIYPSGYTDNIPKNAYKLSGNRGYAYSPERCVYGYYALVTV